ncbi:MAG: UDP-3-O-(3-hydroxymyristoyl)glucosamine N-acyltransferase [Planctomycetaceae bacterium]
MTPQEIANLVQGEAWAPVCEPGGETTEVLLLDVASSDIATACDVAYVQSEKDLSRLTNCRAGAVLVTRSILANARERFSGWLIGVDAPQEAFVLVMMQFRPAPARRAIGISPHAIVSETAKIGDGTNIHPAAVVGDDVVIGSNCDIHPGVVIGAGCHLGDNVTIHPSAVLYPGMKISDRVLIHAAAVIGADGFGYRFEHGAYVKIPHTGTVVLEEDVEVGAGATIDRGMIGSTVIGTGTKIDNQVMIAHNCQIGRHNAFASQVGLAGSVVTGDYVRCAGQAGIAHQLTIGEGALVGPQAGVKDDIPAKESWLGAPAEPDKQFLRTVLNTRKIPEIREQIRTMKKQIEVLTQQVTALQDLSGNAG